MSQARGAIKWALYMIALLVVGPLAAGPLAALRDVSGGHEATALVGTSLEAGLAAVAIALAAGLGLGLLASRVVGPRHGMLVVGLVLAWAAWRSASIDGLMRATRDGGGFVPLAIEGVALGVAGLLIGATVWALGAPAGRGGHLFNAPTEADTLEARVSPFRGVWALLAAASAGRGGSFAAVFIGVVAGGAAVWLVAQEPLKGQTIAACVLAGIAAGGFGRAVMPKTEPASPIPALAAMALLAAIGPLSTLVPALNRGGDVVSAAIQGRLFALAMPMPLDWLAGAFWGIPIGMSWAESMTEKSEQDGHSG